MVGSSPRVFSESIFHDSIFYCSAPLCLGFRLTFKRYIFIYNSSHTNCFPGKVFSYIPLLPWNTERAWKYLCLFGKEIAPPTPHLKVFPLPRREEGHKVLWLIPSLSYQPRSGEQEREKETIRGCKENHVSWVATNDIRFWDRAHTISGLPTF